MITIETPSTITSSVVGFKPAGLLPESQKTEQWIKDTLDWIIAHANVQDQPKLLSLYDMFNGKRDNTQLDYLTKTFGIDYPAKIKHIPLVRPKLNRLIGEEQERGLAFELFSVDRDSVDEKKQAQLQYMLRRYVQLLRGDITEDEYMQDEDYLRRKFRTNKEISVFHFMKAYVHKHRLHEEFSDSFVHKLITGMEFGRVHLNRAGEDPEFQPIPAYEMYYATNDVKWVSECDWGMRHQKMTSTEILDSFGDDLDKEQRDRLLNYREIYGKEHLKLGGGQTMDDLLEGPIDLDNHTSWDSDVFDVYDVEFKSIREIKVRMSDNKYNPEVPFVKPIDDDTYEKLPNNRKKDVTSFYMQDLYRGKRIGPDIFVRLGKVDNPERDPGRPSKVYLTFEGLTFSGAMQPHSLVNITWDLQMLYDIMHFHKENLIAMSGTRGAVMDLSQMPDFGYGFDTEEGFMKNLQMYLYYKKMGTMFIDSSKNRTSQFNQFGSFDDTPGPGLAVILEVIRHLEEVAGDIINVNRQRIGKVGNRDGKAVTEQALDQSALGTEPIFNEHDDFKDRILTKVVNLSKSSYSKNGTRGAYMDKNFEQYTFEFEPEFSLSDYNIFISNRVGTKRTIQELKMAAHQYAQQGLIPFEFAIDIFTTDSLKEIQTKLKEQLTDSQAKMEQQQQQAAELEQQIAMAENQAQQAKLQADIEKIRADIATQQQEIALKEAEVQNDIDYKRGQLILDQKRVDLERLQLELAGKSQGGNAAEVRND